MPQPLFSCSQDTAVRLYAFFDDLSPVYQHFVLLRGVPFKTVAAGRTPIQLVESILAKLKARTTRDLIAFLPPELLIIIGQFAVEDAGSSDIVVTLSAVCRRWRAVFSEHSQLWGNVVLDGKTELSIVVKAAAFAAQGPIRQLTVRCQSSVSMDSLLRGWSGQIDRVRSLDIDLPGASLGQIWKLIERSPELEALIIHLPDAIGPAFVFPFGPTTAHLSIRHVSIHRSASPKDTSGMIATLSWLPEWLPNLEELVVTHPACMLHPLPGHPPQITHSNLRRLTLNGDRTPANQYPGSIFIFPNLRKLDLSGSNQECPFPYLFPHKLAPNTKHLTHLLLSETVFDVPTLIDHLPHLGALTHLDVRRSTPASAPLIGLIHALVHPTAEDEIDESPRLCPLLQVLVLDPFTTELVVQTVWRLVDSRRGSVRLMAIGLSKDGTIRQQMCR